MKKIQKKLLIPLCFSLPIPVVLPLGMANVFGPGWDSKIPERSGLGSTRTGCINNADPVCFFKTWTYPGLVPGLGEPEFPEPRPRLHYFYNSFIN